VTPTSRQATMIIATWMMLDGTALSVLKR